MTSSPAAKPVTPGPVSATTPARSLPCPDGNVAGHMACSSPARILASPGLIPAALTWTSTWPGPGTGFGTSTTFRTSTSPYSSYRTAFTRLPPFLPKSPHLQAGAPYARRGRLAGGMLTRQQGVGGPEAGSPVEGDRALAWAEHHPGEAGGVRMGQDRFDEPGADALVAVGRPHVRVGEVAPPARVGTRPRHPLEDHDVHHADRHGVVLGQPGQSP